MNKYLITYKHSNSDLYPELRRFETDFDGMRIALIAINKVGFELIDIEILDEDGVIGGKKGEKI